MAKGNIDQEFVQYIVKTLVTHSDDVEVARKVDEMGVLLTLKVNQEDLGVIIGKQGKTIQALRVLARIVGAKNNARVNLRLESGDEDRPRLSKKEKSDDVDINL